MTGIKNTKQHRMIVQPRDIAFLRELSVMRVVDREQAKLAGGFGSNTRVNTRMLALTQAGLLRRFFLGYGGGHKGLYSLSEKGAHLAEVPFRGLRRRQDEVLIADYSVQHQLAINSVYCLLKFTNCAPPQIQFKRWLSFHEPILDGLNLVPDGYVEFTLPSTTIASFVEVDLGHEALSVWEKKCQRYLQFVLSEESERQFGQTHFRVIVLANSQRRMESIRATVAKLTQKIFWFSTLNQVSSMKFFTSVWVRPTGKIQQPFFNETL